MLLALPKIISPTTTLLVLLPIALTLYYLGPYLLNAPLRLIPGPPFAAFSNLWLLYQCRRGRRYKAVDDAHRKYGRLVRIQPGHVSVLDEDALGVVYGHGGAWVKSDYYDAFVSIQRGLFNTRDRAEHTRKRKTISHTFSAKSIGQFEEYIAYNLRELVKQWDRLCEQGKGEWVKMDCLHWFNYLAFDIIGDLAFGTPFGMLQGGADIAEVQLSPTSPITHTSAIETLNRRGEVSATIGCLPALKPYAKYLPDPFFRNGVRAVQNLAGIATARVNARLDAPVKSTRKDLLARLMEGVDEFGNPLGREELTAEALTQLIAGSDTTSNTACAFLYYTVSTPHVIPKLQKEIDAAVPPGVTVPSFDLLKDLPYLRACINETLRIHSTSSLGLPRVVPPGDNGVTLLGHEFPSGTVLSVPAYSIHHDPEIWNPNNEEGLDPDQFVPERWEEGRLTEAMRRGFVPFSVGPRACVGRNVAEMELVSMVGCVFGRFEFVVEQEGLETREGFLRKPLGCKVSMRRRMER